MKKVAILALANVLLLLGAGRSDALLCGIDELVGRDFAHFELVGQAKIVDPGRYVGVAAIAPQVEIVGRLLDTKHVNIVSQSLFTPPTQVSQTKLVEPPLFGQASIAPQLEIVGRHVTTPAEIVGQSLFHVDRYVGQEPSCDRSGL